MGEIRDEYGIKKGSVEHDGSKVVVRDEYGNIKNTAEKSNYSSDYIIRDKWGFKKGRAEKQFMSDDRTIKDSEGNVQGTVETSIFNNNKKILKDKKGREMGTFTVPAVGGGISGAGALIIIVALVFAYFSIDSIPMHLQNMLQVGSNEYYFITIPVILEIVMFFFALFKGFFRSTDGVLINVMMLAFYGAMSYIAIDAIIMIIVFIKDSNGFSWGDFFACIIACIAMPLMYATTFLVILIPMMIVGTILIKTIGK